MYESIADLSVSIESASLERLEAQTSSEFTRVTIEVELAGPGPADRDGNGDDREDVPTGRGEDVTYDAAEHDALADAGLPESELTGEFTVDSFSERLAEIDLFPAGGPDRPVFRSYRRWAFEAAALDLALAQAGTDLATELDREPRPVSFVASTRLGDPPTTDRIEALRERVPDLQFKLDPTPEWDRDLVDSLVDVVGSDDLRIFDLKGQYEGTDVDVPADPELYELVIDGVPGAVIEDPALTDATEALFEEPAVRERVSWDAPIHGLDDVRDLPWEPRWLNVKPSRFGSISSLFETIHYCEERGIEMYGGGQFELGVGRAQIQALASLAYPDGPNDVAPRGYNRPDVAGDLPASPLEVPAAFGLGRR